MSPCVAANPAPASLCAVGSCWGECLRSSEVPVKRDIHSGREEGHFFFKSRKKGEREGEGGEEFEMKEEI